MAGEDPGYLAWLRAGPCCLAGKHPCNGPVQAHHNTSGRGMSQKSSDKRAFPLCMWHHRTFHDLTGYFRGWLKAQIREWQDGHSASYRKRYETETF